MTDDNVAKAYAALAKMALKGTAPDMAVLQAIKGKRFNPTAGAGNADRQGMIAFQKTILAEGGTQEAAARVMDLVFAAEEATEAGPPFIGRVKLKLREDAAPALTTPEGEFLMMFLGVCCGVAAQPGEDPPAPPAEVQEQKPVVASTAGPVADTTAPPETIETIEAAGGIDPALLKKPKEKGKGASEEEEGKRGKAATDAARAVADTREKGKAEGPAFRDLRTTAVPPLVPGDPLSFHAPELCLNPRWRELRALIAVAVDDYRFGTPEEREVARKSLLDLPANLMRADVQEYYGNRVVDAGLRMARHVNASLGLTLPAAAAPVI